MSYSEEQLRQAVDAVFNQFDADKSGLLDANEVLALINTALQHMKANRQATQKEVNDLIAAVDKSGDGKIAKPELLEIFKRVANR
jgi:Ca2+-binding EF-hand superfamily protein